MQHVYPKYFSALLLIIPVFMIASFLAGYFGYVGFHSKAKIDLRVEGDWHKEADEVLGYAATRNSSTFRHHVRSGLKYHIFVDSIGARVNTRGQLTSNKISILTVGGSFSRGHGIENDKTFSEILGREFNVPVANFAYGGYGTVQSLLMLERQSNLEPKVIIYGFITHHLERNLSPCAPSNVPYCVGVPYIAFDEKNGPYIHSPVTDYSSKLGKEYIQALAHGDEFELGDIIWGARAVLSKIKRNTIWDHSFDKTSRQKSMAYLMKKMIQGARRINSRLVVVYIPRMEKGNTKPPPTELIEHLSQDTIFVDMSEPIIEHYSNKDNALLRFERDRHPNHLAHELIAREVSRALRTEVSF